MAKVRLRESRQAWPQSDCPHCVLTDDEAAALRAGLPEDQAAAALRAMSAPSLSFGPTGVYEDPATMIGS